MERPKSISDHASMKLKNQLGILQSIRDDGPITRVDIKSRTHLSWGTVTSSTKELLDQRIITEIGSVTTGVGRRPVELDLNRTANFVLGLQLGALLARAVLMDVKGVVVDEQATPVDSRGSAQEMLGALQEAGRRVLQRHAVSRPLLAGVGLAAPGAVDFSTGVCLYAPHHPYLKDVPLKRKIERAFGVPCLVDHDFNCFASAEQLFGFGKGLRNFACVVVGNGMSAGLVLNGEVYRGANSLAGEFGHTCVNPDGPLCACGNHGCMEAVASGSAIAAAARREAAANPDSGILAAAQGDPARITAESVATAARQGDRLAREIYSRMGTMLGVGISNLINMFNPESIIIGGRVSKAADLFLPTCMEAVRNRAWYSSSRDVKISRLERGEALGAAALMLQQIFTTGRILRSGAARRAHRAAGASRSRAAGKTVRRPSNTR
jgi:predicted NBD/HSP70 family sugar kinase